MTELSNITRYYVDKTKAVYWELHKDQPGLSDQALATMTLAVVQSVTTDRLIKTLKEKGR